MAYDLVVGKSPLHKAQPTIVGALSFEDAHALAALHKQHPAWVLSDFSNLYQDQEWRAERLQEGRARLLSLLPGSLSERQRQVVEKLIAVMTYALEEGSPYSASPTEAGPFAIPTLRRGAARYCPSSRSKIWTPADQATRSGPKAIAPTSRAGKSGLSSWGKLPTSAPERSQTCSPPLVRPAAT